MSLRTTNSIEKSARRIPAVPLPIVAGAASVIGLPDCTQGVKEFTARYIQNVGTGNLYYQFGQNITANAVSGLVAQFDGILAGASAIDAGGYGPGQQLDASNDPEAVYVYSPAGTTIVVTQIVKNDISPGTGGIIYANKPLVMP
jgi:hypothetical protein